MTDTDARTRRDIARAMLRMFEEVEGAPVDRMLSALRFAESNLPAECRPSAIREAVEREREACAKIAEGDLFEVRYRSWPHWNPGGNLSRERDVTQLAEATAAAIRARGEEKGNG